VRIVLRVYHVDYILYRFSRAARHSETMIFATEDFYSRYLHYVIKMKTKFSLKKLSRKWAILVILTLLAILAVCTLILWTNFPHDDLREDITMDEAQRLVPFPICVPTYILQGIDSDAQITYHSDLAGVPEGAFIRLHYESIDDQRIIFEVDEVYTQKEGMTLEVLESRVRRAEISLLYWMFVRQPLSEEKLELAREQVQTESSFFQTGHIVWWLYEIANPSQYRPTMTEWINNHVEYRVLSYLPAEVIKNITLSIIKCANRN
jgi:hypothetical protein